MNAESFVEDLPQNYEDIKGRPDEKQWLEAVQEEIDNLNKNNTWYLTKLPPYKRTISCRWVFRIKRNEEGNIARYKARLVVKGCQ